MPERFKVVCISCKALYKCSALPFFTNWATYGTSLYILMTGTGSQSWWRLPTWSRNVDKQYVIFGCIRVINIICIMLSLITFVIKDSMIMYLLSTHIWQTIQEHCRSSLYSSSRRTSSFWNIQTRDVKFVFFSNSTLFVKFDFYSNFVQAYGSMSLFWLWLYAYSILYSMAFVWCAQFWGQVAF